MIGKKLVNRYELMERIGGGGMAVVYKAKDQLLNRIVAVKILRPQFSSDDDFVDRFRREAQAAASLSHANIVNIYDVGLEDDLHFIIMEYINGPTLKEYIAQHGSLAPQEVVKLAKQIAEALEHAHQNNIIHRDIKPHNILLGPGQRIKVTDFGIARAASSSTITHTGSVIGSVHYFSPEQARGGVADLKSDIYSLGIVLYEMVTGKLPFSGDSPISVALKHLQEPLKEPRQLNPDIPQSLENIILRCLAKEPNQRYPSAKELIQDLKTCLLPERLHEPKWTPEDDQNEETKVIPVINEEMLEKNSRLQEDRGTDQEKPKQKSASLSRMSRHRLILAIGLLALLLIVGSYYGVKAYLAAQQVEVPNVYNLPVEEATELLDSLGLKTVIAAQRYNDEVEEGHVLRQNPVEGTKLQKGSVVRLTVSQGKPKIEMPSVINLSEQQARSILRNFTIYTEQQTDEEVPQGYVIAQDPEPGELVIEGETEVRLVISAGKPTIRMPNLKGKTLEEAQAVAVEHGLVIDEIHQGYSGEYLEGQIYQQYPYDPGMEVEKGSHINIWVSQGPETKETSRQITVDPDDVRKGERNKRGKGPKNREVKVEILVHDYNGERTAVNEKIRESKTYSVDVTVSPRQMALIQVLVNDDLYHEEQVAYND